MSEEEQKRGTETRKKNISPESDSPEPAEIISENILEYEHAEALRTEEYEIAAAAADRIQEISDYRAEIRGMRFARFFDIFEDATNINGSGLSPSAKREHIKARASELSQKASRFSPRVADLYQGILAEIAGEDYEPIFPATKDKLNDMREKDDIRALVEPIDGNITWKLKINRIQERLIPFLGAARFFDKRDGNTMDDEQTPEERAMRAEKLEAMNNAPARPPKRRNESKPSMDELDRLKEGERVPAIWSIFPPYGGYYRTQSFSQWDSTRNVWTEPDHGFTPAVFVDKCEDEDPKKGIINFTMKAIVNAGEWMSLPIPYTHGLHSISADSGEVQAMQDENGDIVVMVRGSGEAEITVVASPVKDKVYGPTDPEKVKAPQMPAQFSEETMAELARVAKKSGNGPRAMALASYVRRTIKYSNESKYNDIYDNDPDGYFASIDKHKKADCDVANTYFAALCAQLNIPIRHVVGHSVKGNNLTGSAHIDSGTGHGWSEVWNEKVGAWEKLPWVRVDATPPGDPNLQEDDKGESVGIPGDYGSQEAIRASDEQLEQLRQKLAERKEKLSYTKRERELAEATGVDLKTARAIVKELNEADMTRLPNGERIVDVLGNLFSAIIRERKNITPAYDGPERRSEGGEAITHLIPHVLGKMAGDPDPMSREKSVEQIETQQVFGGLKLYMIGDKSGSMQHTVDEEKLWQMQRRAIYLNFASLYRFANSIQAAHLPYENSLDDVGTQATSFRGDSPEQIDVDKPLSPKFTDPNRVTLWNSLTNQGAGNGDATALGYVLDQIKKEIEEEKKDKTYKPKIRLVVACSDGGYVGDDAMKMQQLAEELYKLGVIVVGMGLTESAAEVPVVMNNPPYSRGDIARDINDLPALIAKHLILEAIKLFPDRTKQDVQRFIEETIKKFKPLST